MNEPPSSRTNENINGLKYNGIKANIPKKENLVNKEPNNTLITMKEKPRGYIRKIIASTIQSNQLVTM